MVYQLRFFKGLRHPNDQFHQLEKAETIYDLRLRFFLLFAASVLIFAVISMFGLGTNEISGEVNILTNSQFEWEKFLFLLGRILLGFIFPALYLYLMSLWFWIWTDADYRKLMVVHSFVLMILLTEQVIHTIFVVWLGLGWFSSPLSLGVIAQSLDFPKWLIAFLGCITVFKIWALTLQYIGIRKLARTNRAVTILLVLSIHLIYWAIAATLAFFELKTFF
ncbi:hypothetical protein [Falsibacillus albus]|uniref:Yip1 domain-containing protein n=1 Tax=Falsibacillus albus TaxID=2478915 RepID=A0A3L7K2J9_9BACI|nr:hypothetical protein [Falsibacillus albus]RLQ96845.1 hypothetical protein D9X91_07030 [Falsibacillus albus]